MKIEPGIGQPWYTSSDPRHSDFEVRREALDQAVRVFLEHPGDTVTLEVAEAYYDFLSGKA